MFVGSIMFQKEGYMTNFKKKAFTTIELLMCLIVSTMLISMMFLLLYHTTSLYNNTVNRVSSDGFALILVSDVENLTRGCDYVETAEEGRILIVHDHNEKYSIDTNDYGIDARMLVDPAKKLITIYIGGEAYCIPYMQNDPG